MSKGLNHCNDDASIRLYSAPGRTRCMSLFILCVRRIWPICHVVEYYFRYFYYPKRKVEDQKSHRKRGKIIDQTIDDDNEKKNERQREREKLDDELHDLKMLNIDLAETLLATFSKIDYI